MKVSHAFFAATLIAIGILGFANGTLPYYSAIVSLVCGAGLLWPRTAIIAARVLLASLIVWWLVSKVRFIVTAPLTAVSYETNGETAVLVAAALMLSALFAHKGVRTSRVIFALSMIAFGVAHFAYVKLTAGLVPKWLPAPLFWAYFTGCTYIAAGVAMLIGRYARLAAYLATAQIGLFTLLVWVPVVLAAGFNAQQWNEFVISWAMTAAAWVVADSYRAR